MNYANFMHICELVCNNGNNLSWYFHLIIELRLIFSSKQIMRYYFNN